MQVSGEHHLYVAFIGSITLLGILVSHRMVLRRRLQESFSPPNSPPWTVGVIGSGAVGTVAGLKLLQGDSKGNKKKIAQVVLVGRSSLSQLLQSSTTESNETPSLTIVEDFPGGSTHSFPVSNNPRLQVLDSTAKDNQQDLKCLLQSCHIIFIATKTVHTERVAKDLAELLKNGDNPTDMVRTIISLQNGLHNAKPLQEHLGSDPNVECLASVVAFAAEWEQNSTRFHITLPGGKVLMPLPSRSGENAAIHRERVQTLARLWTLANLPSQMTKLFRLVRYLKFLINLINPINALAGVTVPVQMLDRRYRTILAETIREGTVVLYRYDGTLKEGILDRWLVWMIGCWVVPALLTWMPDFFFQISLRQKSRSSSAVPAKDKAHGSNYKSSMLQDLERRRTKTEIDNLSGYIVFLGQANDYPTPLNSQLCELIRHAETAGMGSPKLSSKEFCQTLGML